MVVRLFVSFFVFLLVVFSCVRLCVYFREELVLVVLYFFVKVIGLGVVCGLVLVKEIEGEVCWMVFRKDFLLGVK